MPVPHTAPALSDDDVVPVRGLSYLREPTAAMDKAQRMLFILDDFV